MAEERPAGDDPPRLDGRTMVGCIVFFWAVVFGAITWVALRDILEVF